jgi:hypothetical protein
MSDALLDEIHINMQGRVVMRYADGKCVDVTDTWGRKLYSAPYPQALQSGEPVGYIVRIDGDYKFYESYEDAQDDRASEEYWYKDLDHAEPEPVYTAPQPVVPEGYVLVPLEPSEAMLQAAFECPVPAVNVDSISGMQAVYNGAKYKAMLSAGKGGE